MSSGKKKGLGRGLSALFGDQTTEKKDIETKEINKVSISDITRNPYQPRESFNEAKLDELSNSIKKNGIIQPIAVRLNKGVSGKYEIVAGERRWLAAQRAGLHEIPVNILELSDVESLEVAIVENIQRDDLNIIEEAKAFKRLADEFDYDHDKIAKLMSKSRSHISNTLRLLSLPQDVKGMIEEGNLTAGQARPLIGLPNASEIAENIVKKKVAAREIELLVKNKKTKSKSDIRDPNIQFIQNEIESKLGLSIEIVNKKNNSGKIVIKYKSLDQFELISKKLRK